MRVEKMLMDSDIKNRILVVDDEQMILKAVKRLLRKDGYRMKYALSGSEALDIAETFIPDLVILDIMMPGIDGYETCRRLKSEEKTAGAMVLLLSGKKTLDDRLKGYEAKADDFISKPFDPDELKAKIEILLRLKNTQEKLLLEIAEKKEAEALLLQTNKDLKDAVSRAEKLTREAQRANQAKSQFLANMSHELHTPLNGVLGLTQVLLESGIDEKQKRYVVSLEKSGQALLFALDNILDFSKLEANELLLETQVFNPGYLLEDVVDIFQADLDAKNIKMSCDVNTRGKFETISGDKKRFRQVLLNLLSNAVKFTPSGTITVSLDLENTVADSVTLAAMVTDTGPGIEDTLQSRIFEPFSQVDGSLARKEGGMGIGLSISRKLARLMGGDLRVESRAGHGSTFVFTCAMHSAPEPVVKEKKATKRPAENNERKTSARILIAEDNPVNRKVVGIMLSKVGHQITMACDGREAVDIFFGNPDAFDMIFMDVQMPEMDGLEATRTIRKKDETRIPIVALTAHAMKGDREKCIESGMDDYMTKPIKKETLLKMVQKWGLSKK